MGKLKESEMEALKKDPQLSRFVDKETQKQIYQNLVDSLTERCWDVCMDKPTFRLEPETRTCLENCVQRFLDSTNFVVNRIDNSKMLTDIVGAIIDNDNIGK